MRTLSEFELKSIAGGKESGEVDSVWGGENGDKVCIPGLGI